MVFLSIASLDHHGKGQCGQCYRAECLSWNVERGSDQSVRLLLAVIQVFEKSILNFEIEDQQRKGFFRHSTGRALVCYYTVQLELGYLYVLDTVFYSLLSNSECAFLRARQSDFFRNSSTSLSSIYSVNVASPRAHSNDNSHSESEDIQRVLVIVWLQITT